MMFAKQTPKKFICDHSEREHVVSDAAKPRREADMPHGYEAAKASFSTPVCGINTIE